ncbi:MAG: hypothetical protein HGA79_09615 [Anaerolineales bacterium]|nr:hypothetical protein [Anaerolineales bacterium]
MINFNISTVIYRPVKQIFDYVSAPENDFQWQYGTLASTRITEGESGVGSHFRSVGHLMGHRVQSTFEVIAFDANTKYEFKSLSGPLLSQIAYTFEMINGGTKLNLSMQANVVNFMQMDEGILEKRMKKQFKENLAMLKDLLEVKRMLPASEANLFVKSKLN